MSGDAIDRALEVFSAMADAAEAERDRAREIAVALEQQVARVDALATEWHRTADECGRLARRRAGLGDERDLATAALINRKRANDLRDALNPEEQP